MLRIMQQMLRIVLQLKIGVAENILALGNSPSILDPDRYTRNKQCQSLLDLHRNMLWEVSNGLSLGNRSECRIVLCLAICRGSKCILGSPWSILDDWATNQ